MKTKITIILAALLMVSLLTAGAGFAQTVFSLVRWSVSGGGGQSAGAGYHLQGSAGQSAAIMVQGPGYSLCSGFWCAVDSSPGGPPAVYLPLVRR